MVQTTFTRQKRELAKAAALLERLRAQEVRKILRDSDGKVIETKRDAYVDTLPQEIARQVLDIAQRVVSEHGTRQKANSRNTGRFVWGGVEAELTVPQLRALQDVSALLSELVTRLPRRNPRLMPNTEVDGRPAFAHREEKHYRREIKFVPFEEDTSTRVRTYEEPHDILDHTTQTVEIDFGLEVAALEKLQELVPHVIIDVPPKPGLTHHSKENDIDRRRTNCMSVGRSGADTHG